MCVIIAKRAGDKIDREYLEHMMIRGANSNRDGCGFALKKSGTDEIIFSKGYRESDAAVKLIDFLKQYEIEEGDEFMFHARIGTSGRRDQYNTHPFVLGEMASESDDAIITLMDLHLKRPCFAHNGVFGEYSDYKSRWNDTFHFGDLFLSQEDVVEDLMSLDEKDIEVKYKRDFDYNKVSIMFPGRTPMRLVGNFSTNKGLWFSNRMWEYDDHYRNIGGVETFGKSKSTSCDTGSCNIPSKTNKLLVEDTSEEGSFDANVELIFEKEEKATPNSGRTLNWNSYAYDDDDEIYGDYYKEFQRKKEEKKKEERIPTDQEKVTTYLDINLTESNCKELFMLPVDGYDGIQKGRIYEVTFQAQASGFFWVQEFKAHGTSVLKTGDFLNKMMNFVPRESFRAKYRDYKYLCFALQPSKNKAKDVRRILENALKKVVKEVKLKGLADVRVDALVEYYNQKLLCYQPHEQAINLIEEGGYPFLAN